MTARVYVHADILNRIQNLEFEFVRRTPRMCTYVLELQDGGPSIHGLVS